jgi:hypothetical protein
MTNFLARPRRALALALLVCAAAASSGGGVQAAQVLTVKLDQARIEKLPEKASTIVIGNPLIADVSIQQGGLMVLTGKGYGTTNMIALDRNGAVVSEHTILVQAPTEGLVVVYRGTNRETFSCTPRCERAIVLGDSPEFFNATLGQAATRSARAAGAAAPTTQGGGGAPAR